MKWCYRSMSSAGFWGLPEVVQVTCLEGTKMMLERQEDPIRWLRTFLGHRSSLKVCPNAPTLQVRASCRVDYSEPPSNRSLSLAHLFVSLDAGGKTSGIFGESEPRAQPQKITPPGGPTNNIFGGPENAPVQSPSRSHPNKPKVLKWFSVSWWNGLKDWSEIGPLSHSKYQ